MGEVKEVVNLSSIEGNEVIVRRGTAREIFQYNGFNYSAFSTGSFIDLVKAKAVRENCVIAYNENNMTAILDDLVIDRRQDRVKYSFVNSLQAEEWKEILKDGKTFDQRSLIKFLQRREPDEIDDLEFFISMLQNFKYVTNIQGDFSQADDQNYTFMIKVGEQEGSIKIPQFIYLNLEIFNESDFSQKVEVEVEVYKPKQEGEKPLIRLSCPKYQRYQKEAVESEIIKLKEQLSDYLIITGEI